MLLLYKNLQHKTFSLPHATWERGENFKSLDLILL